MRDAARKECPSLEELAAVFEGRIGSSRHDLQHHLQECAFCRTEWEMLGEFAGGKVDAAERADVSAIVDQLRDKRRVAGVAPWWRNLFALPAMVKFAGAVAAVALALALGLQWQASRKSDLGQFTGAGDLRSGRGITVQLVGDFQEIPAALGWEAISGAASYEVTFKEVDGTEIWRGKSAEPRVAVEQQVRSAMAPRKTLLWEVTAFDGDGKLLAGSGEVRIRRMQP